jgi:hypothetical protein
LVFKGGYHITSIKILFLSSIEFYFKKKLKEKKKNSSSNQEATHIKEATEITKSAQ